MKYREVIRAIDGFKYEVKEHDVFPSGRISTRIVLLSTSQTNIRCLQYNHWHEKQLKGGQWYLLTEDQFREELNYFRAPKVITRKPSGLVNVVKKIELNLIDSIDTSEHFEKRVLERFNVERSEQRSFVEKVLKDHFIVQNFQFYNGRYKDNDPDSIVVCSRDLKTILVLKANPRSRKYQIITCYATNTWGYEAFQNWFNDHMDKLHELPKLQDYYAN